ncbi:hypothetical protein PN836_003075 [Ningiella sp. W23]|uniref:hypothetical protein n=1 Tax=Ningiella sp. W23 TaxID=3023715 RepID=UPI003758163E
MKIYKLTIFSLLLSASSSVMSEANGSRFIYDSMGSNSVLLSTCDKFAGAVCGLTFNGVQLVDNDDHGRQIQTAIFYPNTISNSGPESFVPTEAGSRFDGNGSNSSSYLHSISSSSDSVTTSSSAAFWLQPNECTPAPPGSCALNTTILSDTVISKKITIGYVNGGVNIPHAIEFDTSVKLEPSLPINVNYGDNSGSLNNKITFEIFSGHFTPDLNTFYSFDPHTGSLNYEGNNGYRGQRASIITNNSRTIWLGLYTPDENIGNTNKGNRGYHQVYNAVYLSNVGSSFSGKVGMVKMNSSFRAEGAPNQIHQFKMYLAIGKSEQDIKTTLSRLYQYVN